MGKLNRKNNKSLKNEVRKYIDDCNAMAIGKCSEAEGCHTKAVGDCSHAEGCCTKAKGDCSHAEGYCTKAKGDCSHAEGCYTKAKGDFSHAEGKEVSVSGIITKTIASGKGSHAEGGATSAIGDYAHTEGTNTVADGTSSHAEGTSTIASGSACHAEGNTTMASGENAHAEGNQCTASGINSHAEGLRCTASGTDSHAEGAGTLASGGQSHVEGNGSWSIGFTTHAEGLGTEASDEGAHSEGRQTRARGKGSHTEGTNTEADGDDAHAEGRLARASGEQSHAEGLDTSTAGFQGAHIMGRYGDACDSFSWFMAGGTDTNTRAVTACIKNNGDAFLDSVNVQDPCCTDYAEYFETANGFAIDVGYFVTFEKGSDKIRKANLNDDYILGIVSATPAILAGASDYQWHNRYMRDEWGRIQYQEVIIPAVKNNEGEIVKSEQKELRPILNSDWNCKECYVPRSKRPEWVAVGLLGQLLIRDSGECVPGDYCIANDEGIAVPLKEESKKGYKVIKRTGKNQIMILFR